MEARRYAGGNGPAALVGGGPAAGRQWPAEPARGGGEAGLGAPALSSPPRNPCQPRPRQRLSGFAGFP
jgi:hypothetical protein